MSELVNYFQRTSEDDFQLKKPYLIAEAGVNHEGSMDLARRLVEEAAEGGAQAIKFQTYKAETIAAKNSPAYWDRTKEPTESQFQLFKKYDKFWKSEYEELKRCCDEFSIEFLSTPFDVDSAAFLNDLMPVFKISSSDLTNWPFIETLCEYKKPILLSTGASTLQEIDEAVKIIERKGNALCLMHCILNYPTPDERANLGMILDLKQKFPNHPIGYSDHTLPEDMRSLEIATLLGASILEKHFTHDKTLPGNDHYHAMDKEDMKAFWENIERGFTLLGSFDKVSLPEEEPARQNARRSLVARVDIPKDEVVMREHLTWKRPASGISPTEIETVVGKRTAVLISQDDILQWKMLQNK